MNNHFFSALRAFLKKYKFRLGGLVLGAIAGWWGALVGFLTGFFIETIVLRTAEEVSLAAYFANPAGKKVPEPFSGAALLCALAVACCRDARFAEKQVSVFFPLVKTELWHVFCSAAARTRGETDLLTESLAAKLRTVKDVAIIEGAFKVLQATEFGWQSEMLGNKPTQYLSQLLNYSFYSDDYAAACAVLGIDTDAPLEKIKAERRKLASVYHPDTLSALSDEQQKIASDAFLRVQKAYETILGRF